MAVFWFENVVIGIGGILRILFARGGSGNLFTALFFVLHYGGFMAGHAMILVELFGPEAASGEALLPALLEPLRRIDVMLVIAALAVSHAWSFVGNYIGAQEYERLDPKKAMQTPYRRMVITHVALLFGGIAVEKLGQPLIGLVLLVALKIAMDLRAHLAEHRELQAGEMAIQ